MPTPFEPRQLTEAEKAKGYTAIVYIRSAPPTLGKGVVEVVDPRTGKATGTTYAPWEKGQYEPGGRRGTGYLFVGVPARPEVQAAIARREDIREAKELAEKRGEAPPKSPSETWEDYIARTKAAGLQPQFPSGFMAKKYGYPVTPEIRYGERRIPVLAEQWGVKKVKEIETIETAKAREVAEKEAERQRTLGERIKQSLFERQAELVLRERPEAKAAVTPEGWAVVPPTAKVYPKEFPILRKRKERKELEAGALFQIEKKRKEKLLPLLIGVKKAKEKLFPPLKKMEEREEEFYKRYEAIGKKEVPIITPISKKVLKEVGKIYRLPKLKKAISKAKEVRAEVIPTVKRLWEAKLKLPTRIDIRTGRITERKELKEILPEFKYEFKGKPIEVPRAVTRFEKALKIEPVKGKITPSQLFKGISKAEQKYYETTLAISKRMYGEIRERPERIIKTYGAGLVLGGILKGAGVVAAETGVTARYGRWLATQEPFIQKTIFHLPKVALAGLYAGVKGKQISELPKEERLPEAVTGLVTEYYPFVKGMKHARLAFEKMAGTELRLRAKARAPVRFEERIVKPRGKITPIKAVQYGYGVEVPAKKGFKIDMKPEQYARYLEARGKLIYEPFVKMPKKYMMSAGTFRGPGGGKLAKISISKGVRVSPKLEKPERWWYEIPSERTITLKHELIHYKTPEPLFFVEDVFKIPYKYQPSEVIARTLAPRIKTFGVKVGKQTYEDLLKSYRTLTVVKPEPTGAIRFEYPRELKTVKAYGKAPTIGLQRGEIKKLGEKFKIIQTQIGRKPTGVIRGETIDIYFRKVKEGIKLRYVTKTGRVIKDIWGKKTLEPATVLKETIIPYKKEKLLPFKEVIKTLKPTRKEIGIGIKEAGAEFYPRKEVSLRKVYRLIGKEQKLKGLKEVKRAISVKARAELFQRDTATAQIETLSERAGKQWKQFSKIARLPTIEYAYQPTYKPHKVIIEKYGGKLIRRHIGEPILTQRRRLISETGFRYLAKETRIKPLKALGISIARLGKRGELLYETKPAIERVIKVKVPTPRIPREFLQVRGEPILSFEETKRILSLRPTVMPVIIPLPVTKPITRIEPITRVKPVTRIKPITRPIIKPITEVKPKVEIKPIVEVKPITEVKPIVEVKPRVEVKPKVVTKPKTITEAVTKAITQVRAITRVPTRRITITPPPSPPPPPPFIPLPKFPEFKPKIRKKKKPFELAPTYKPSLVGVERYKYTGVTIPRPPAAVGLGERPITTQMIKDIKKIAGGMI